MTGARRLQPWSGGPSLADGGGGGDGTTSRCDGGLAAADGRGDGGGGDVANTPPGCTEMSLQSNRKRAPLCPQARMYVSNDGGHQSADADATK